MQFFFQIPWKKKFRGRAEQTENMNFPSEFHLFCGKGSEFLRTIPRQRKTLGIPFRAPSRKRKMSGIPFRTLPRREKGSVFRSKPFTEEENVLNSVSNTSQKKISEFRFELFNGRWKCLKRLGECYKSHQSAFKGNGSDFEAGRVFVKL